MAIEDNPDTRPQRRVSVTRSPLQIPTYLPAPPDRYPAYLDNRVYQGSSGRVYPLPFHERIAQRPTDHTWDAVVLCNEWVSLTLLPELGGRIAWGTDLTRGYDLFYRNQVIKPALVGLAGPWISGGIEFNWPQHHRPATFLPTSVTIEREDDGAVTVWCSDHDPFARMKGMHGVRLRPDSSVIEVRVRLFNRSDDVQTFLWWANVAAHANDRYQSFFPTDVHHVADHARRAVTTFPAANSRYYGWDYPAAAQAEPGADRLDFYRNVRVPTSYMCVETADDFFGGFDHDAGAGFVHVADHRIAPGKKQWTWGNAPFGWAWDANLTDSDGPYVELMAGVYTDNQPDFTFLQPGETKTFSQYWYPIQDIGAAHQATIEAAGRLDMDGTTACIGVALTRAHQQLNLEVRGPTGEVLGRSTHEAGPGKPVRANLDVGTSETEGLTVVVADCEGRTLLTWTTSSLVSHDEPIPATEPPAPAEIASNDELYLTGLYLQQYRHATRRPDPYWEEAIARDPGDARCLTALAVSALRVGLFHQAEQRLRAAIARLTRRNPNPRETEAYFRLGQVLERTGRVDEALDAYGKAGWNAEWRDPADLAMARMLAARHQDEAALDLVLGGGTPRNPHNQARCLEAILLQRLQRDEEAERVLARLRAVDPLDVWAADLAGEPVGTDAPTLLDVALEYASVGEFDRADQLLMECAQAPLVAGQVNVAPLAHLHRADLCDQRGRSQDAMSALTAAQREDPTWCFPSRPQDLSMLIRLATGHVETALVQRLLGHQLYHLGRRDEAMAAWARAVELDDSDGVTRRNLAVASHNQLGDLDAARAHYVRARQIAPRDARLLYETDQLAKRHAAAPAQRLAALEQDRELVSQRDDLTIELATLLTGEGRAEEALEILSSRLFQPWEGGEGTVLAAWEECHLALARDALVRSEANRAVKHLDAALEPPSSLGEARHPLANHAHLRLALGDVLAALGRGDQASEQWHAAATFVGDFQTMTALPWSDMTYYSVLACQRLQLNDQATHMVAGLAEWADSVESSRPTVDYFATSLPSMLLFTDDLQRRQRVGVHVLRAQVATLRGDQDEARRYLDQALAEDPYHPRAIDLARSQAMVEGS